jgi:hypothetical protein
MVTTAVLHTLDQDPHRWVRYPAIGMILMFSGIQFSCMLASVWPQYRIGGMFLQIARWGIVDPRQPGPLLVDPTVSTEPDETLMLIERLKPMLSRPGEDRIAVIPLSLFATLNAIYPITITLIAREEGLGWTAAWPRRRGVDRGHPTTESIDFPGNDWSTNFKDLSRDFDRVIVGPVDTTPFDYYQMQGLFRGGDLGDVGMELVRLWRLGRLESSGFHLDDVIALDIRHVGELKFLVLSGTRL